MINLAAKWGKGFRPAAELPLGVLNVGKHFKTGY
jgi:hypothetical protein